MQKIFHHEKEIISLLKGHHFLNQEKQYVDIKLKGHNLNEFKGEKISGSLKFIDLISPFQSVTEVKKFVYDLEKLNKDILPILLNEIQIIDSELQELQDELTMLQPIYDKYIEEKDDYDKLKINLREDLSTKNKYDNILALIQDTNKHFLLKYPKYDKFMTEYNSVTQRYNKIKSEIKELEKIKKNIQSYISSIETYLISHHITS